MAKRVRPKDQAAVIGKKIAQTLGFELLETAFDKEPAGMYLRFYLDREGGIHLNDCEAFHRAVQPLLESVDYDFLEVCSPGIDRPIKTLAAATKAIGQEVEVKLYKPQHHKKEFQGILLAACEESYTIQVDQEEVVLLTKEIALIRRVVDLSALDVESDSQEE